MSCKIINDVVGCQKMFGGGIEDVIYLYDKSESIVLYDDDLNISSMEGPYTRLQGSNWSYQQGVSNENYSHSLKGEVILDAVEEFYNAQNEDFIVVFKSKNGEYSCFGDRFGAKLSFQQGIDTSKSVVSVSFDNVSNTPVKTVDATNFIEDKVYTILFQNEGQACSIEGTGYLSPAYRLFVNINGEALDRNGRLVRLSGNKQGAYKLEGQPDADYDIVETYDETKYGVFDPDACPVTITGTISVDTNLIEIDTTNDKVKTFTVSSDANWSILNIDEITTFSVSKTYGTGGDTSVSVFGGTGGDETLEIINNETNEVVRVQVKSYIVSVEPEYSIGGSIRTFSIPVNCNGGFSVTKNMPDSDVSLSIQDSVIYLIFKHSFTEFTELVLTLTHFDYADEQKQTRLLISPARSTDPNWVLVSEFCTVEEL